MSVETVYLLVTYTMVVSFLIVFGRKYLFAELSKIKNEYTYKLDVLKDELTNVNILYKDLQLRHDRLTIKNSIYQNKLQDQLEQEEKVLAEKRADIVSKLKEELEQKMEKRMHHLKKELCEKIIVNYIIENIEQKIKADKSDLNASSFQHIYDAV